MMINHIRMQWEIPVVIVVVLSWSPGPTGQEIHRYSITILHSSWTRNDTINIYKNQYLFFLFIDLLICLFSWSLHCGLRHRTAGLSLSSSYLSIVVSDQWWSFVWNNFWRKAVALFRCLACRKVDSCSGRFRLCIGPASATAKRLVVSPLERMSIGIKSWIKTHSSKMEG